MSVFGVTNGVAVPLPLDEAAGQRGGVVVAELAERLGREGRPRADRAVRDDLARLVRHERLDPRLEVAAGNVDRAGQVTLLPLVLLAHVDEERTVGVVEAREHVRGGDLVDLVLDLGEQLSIGRPLLSRV